MDKLTHKELDKRLRLDYNKTEADVRAELKALLPEETPERIERLLKSKYLDRRRFHGVVRFFRSAARNLFRLDKSMHPLRNALKLNTGDWRKRWTKTYMPSFFDKETGERLQPVTYRYRWNFKLTVKADAVPAGEVIRCWLPMPKTIGDYQLAGKDVVASRKDYILSEGHSAHNTIYMEKKAVAGKPTVFKVRTTFQTVTETHDFSSVKQSVEALDETFQGYLCEQLPHIVFSERVKELSKQIVRPDDTPWEKTVAIFEWISRRLPWVSAREYSTIPCIPDHVIEQGGGDCGEKTLLFISLCRYNGIPARWQSGFMLHHTHQNLHDWAEVYIPGHGWVAVDASFGLMEHFQDTARSRFYLGNRDGHHLVVNTAISDDLFPKKRFPRSETVDFQRGEVEWKGGNLYFDQWNYTFSASKIK